MRIKYFLRGVGIGIIVTTIILSVAHNSNRELTDSEIIERAGKLGMSFTASGSESQTQSVEETESTSSISSQQETSGEEQDGDKESQSNETESDEGQSDGGQSEADMDNAGVTDETQTDTVTDNTEDVATDNEPAIEQSTANQSTASGSLDTTTQASVSCKLNIVAGMSSRTVCDMLKQNEIIADAAEFDSYLVSIGYDDKIRTGEVEVNSDMTYEELAAALYKKK